MGKPRRSALLVSAVLAGGALLAAPGSAQAAPACPVAPYGVQTTAPGAGKTVALTFDGGPGVSTEAILRILEDNGVTATFFNLGEYLADRPSTVQAEAAHGYLLGNHTWDHPHMTTLPAAGQADQMDRYNAEQTRLVGFPACVFRPPFGEYDSTTLSVAQSRNMSVWNWSVDTIDWQEEGSSSPESINRIITRAEAGASQSHPVILMHNGPVGNPATVAALPTIISFYRDRGYTFVDLVGRVGNRLPFGAYDSAAANGTGAIAVRGWAIDADTPAAPTRIHVYVDGRGAASVAANLSRPDVARVYPWAGALHGFSASAQAGPGRHSVCVYAIDTSVSSMHTLLGCRTATVSPRLPFGAYDTAVANGTGGVAVSGWAIDADTPTAPTRIHVYVDGRGAASVAADGSRPDVARVYPWAGALHGFTATVPAGSGAHSVCIYAIDTSFSTLHTALGCRTVTAP